ncbi:MAG: type III-B CRISPR module RAMP protein Cmr6 [Thiothrix lacustris]|uniref:Type III-B CRISPR module RAMP protein Cmr6 n=1 Tax=Thiothrix lacustris TaxID=525917 RepID=A0A1Y1QW73_9GAMM|nr:MAG: type III-B CRISPR module RAMP protein Cmr6 [Thiothrix lacustris]
MTVPLYSDHEKPSCCDGNQGLWFERFFDQYDDNHHWEVLKPTTNNNQMGNTYWLLKHFNNKTIGDKEQLVRHNAAQSVLATSLQGQSPIFKASGYFVTGMGNSHPVENGFAWHPTLGVPYLTGAAVKGFIRSYIENWLDDSPENKQDLLLKWFGSIDKDPQISGGKMQAGELIFFDALPIQPVTLGVDIMTPHMGKWYEKGGDITDAARQPEAVPADWHDPVPVAFLVAKAITLQFSFALRRPNSGIDLNDVKQALTLALEHAGAGGKTATGYGGMHVEILSCPWVDETIQALATKNRVPENKRDQVIYGKGLAEAWQALTDETVKKAALTDIRSRWKSDMWDDPQGGSVKAAKKIYSGL